MRRAAPAPKHPSATAPGAFAAYHHAAVAFPDGTILVAGGQGGKNGAQLLASFWTYRPSEDRWIAAPSPFRGRIDPGLALVPGAARALLVGGGAKAESFAHESEGRRGGALQDAWVFTRDDGNPTGGTWRQVPDAADGQDCPTVVPFGEDLLVVSRYPARWVAREEDFALVEASGWGARTQATSHRDAPLLVTARETVVWNQVTRRWTTLPGLVPSRFAGALVPTAKGVLCVGGRIPGGDVQGSIDLFDGARWERVGSLASPRAFHAVVTAGDRTLVVGGFGSTDEDLPVEELDVGTARTRATDRVLPPMTAFQAVASRDRVCVLGGHRSGPTRSEPFAPLGVTWL